MRGQPYVRTALVYECMFNTSTYFILSFQCMHWIMHVLYLNLNLDWFLPWEKGGGGDTFTLGEDKGQLRHIRYLKSESCCFYTTCKQAFLESFTVLMFLGIRVSLAWRHGGQKLFRCRHLKNSLAQMKTPEEQRLHVYTVLFQHIDHLVSKKQTDGYYLPPKSLSSPAIWQPRNSELQRHNTSFSCMFIMTKDNYEKIAIS